MSKIYSLFNKRTNIFEPTLSRDRQPYSAPISSGSLNLHFDQLIVDISRLRNNVDKIETKIEEVISLISNQIDQATPGYYEDESLLMTIFSQNITYDEGADSYVVESATPYYEDVLSFYKPEIISSNIEFLKNKLNILEKTINIE
jgi:hypothetical protein